MTKDEIMDAVGGTWTQIMEQFGEMTEAGIRRELDQMFGGEDNAALAAAIYIETL